MSNQQYRENEWRALQAQVDKPKSAKFFMLLVIGLLAGGGVGFFLGTLTKGMTGIVQ